MGQTVDAFDTNIKVGDVVQITMVPLYQEGQLEIENNKVKIMITVWFRNSCWTWTLPNRWTL